MKKVTHSSSSPILGSILGSEQNKVWTNRDNPGNVWGIKTKAKRSGWRSRVLSLGISTAWTDLVTVPRIFRASCRTEGPRGAVSSRGQDLGMSPGQMPAQYINEFSKILCRTALDGHGHPAVTVAEVGLDVLSSEPSSISNYNLQSTGGTYYIACAPSAICLILNVMLIKWGSQGQWEAPQ